MCPLSDAQHAAEVADVLDEALGAPEPCEGVGEVAVLRICAHLAGAGAAPSSSSN